MSQNSVVLFLSCGRTGTQWFADKLARYYSDLAQVEHEPLKNAYQAGRFFRQKNASIAQKALPEIAQHFDSIKTSLGQKHYIETGWPAYAAIPAFLEQFSDRFKLVHLVRNPLNNAASMTTLHFYSPRNLEEKAFFDTYLLTPHNTHVQHPEYASIWNKLTFFEKNLFQWLEINSWGNELPKLYPQLAYYRLKFEDVFGPSDAPLEDALNFMGLPLRSDMIASRLIRKDDHGGYTHHSINPTILKRHPHVLRLAAHYGYSQQDLFPSPGQIAQRYSESKNVPWNKRLERTIKRLFRS